MRRQSVYRAAQLHPEVVNDAALEARLGRILGSPEFQRR
jgi:hypothetical protein